MNKEAYLDELAQYLKTLPPEELTDIMIEFREHFEFAQLSGRSEAEVISKLGNPRLVAREVLTQSHIEKADKSPTLLSVTKAVMATVSLGLFNLIIVMLPFVASLVLIAGVFGFAIFLIISPIWLMIQNPSLTAFFNDIFLMLALVGGGLLIVIGTLKFTRIYYNLVIRYLKSNLKVIKKDVTYVEK